MAEAQNELGNNAESIKWINLIRKRAGLMDLPTGATKETLRNEIFKERAIEFVGEFQRRFDLVRWGKLEESVKATVIDNPIGAAKISAKHQYFPIAQEEIVKNPNLKQNDGY